MNSRHLLIEVAVEPKSRADQEKLIVALATMVTEDASFEVQTDEESGQTIMRGSDEVALASKVERLRHTYKVQANVGAPQVAYRETLSRRAVIDYTHKRQTGGTGQFARVKLVFEPGEPGSGFVFESEVVGGSVPEKFVPGVEKGLRSVKDNGLLAGFPLIDFSATLVDGAFHHVDSSVFAFEIAARAAFRDLREKGAPRLIEPIMNVEVLTPEDYVDGVIEGLKDRRGQIHRVEARDDGQAITASVPLANMFGYAAALRTCADANADFAMTFSHYAPCPIVMAEPDPDLFPPAAAMRA